MAQFGNLILKVHDRIGPLFEFRRRVIKELFDDFHDRDRLRYVYVEN